MQLLKKLLRFLYKFLIRFIYWSLILSLVIFTLLQLPFVQTYLAGKATTYLSRKTKYPITISEVSIRWLNIASLKDVKVKDLQGNQMIDVPELTVAFYLPDFFSKRDIWLNEVTLDKANVRLVVNKNGDINMDDFVIALSNLNESTDTTHSDNHAKFGIRHVRLLDSYFSYNEKQSDSIKNGIDYLHFGLKKLNGDAFNFFILGDTISLEAKALTAIDQATNWHIQSLSTDFLYCKKSMGFRKLEGMMGSSIIKNELIFNYTTPGEMSDFINKVKISANLDSTIISVPDLALFAPQLKNYNDDWTISGKFRGTIKKCRVRDFDLYFGKKSHLKGAVSLEGLPNFDGTFINFSFSPSKILTSDLSQYIQNHFTNETIQKFGFINFHGHFQGFTNNFVSDGKFHTGLGGFESDLSLQLAKNSDDSKYKGQLITHDLDLGTLIDQPDLVQKLDMDGSIEGKGFTVGNGSISIQANVPRIGIYFYDYKNIKINGKLVKQSFKGFLDIKDPNVIFTANGEVDLRNNKNLFDLVANVEKVDIMALGFSQTPFNIKTQLNVNFQGLEADKIVGEAKFTKSEINYGTKDLLVDSLFISSQKDSALNRNFHLVSDFINVDAQGNFEFTKLMEDAKTLIKEYRISFQNNKTQSKKYYQKKSSKIPQKYNINYKIDLTDINPLLTLFYPSVTISPETQIEGNFSTGKNSIFAFNTTIKNITYNNYAFHNTVIDFNTSKLFNDASILASCYINSNKQELAKAAETEKLTLEAIWFNDHIEFENNVRQYKTDNFAILKGDLYFFEDRMEMKLKPSSIQVLDKNWHFANDNLITFREKEINFKNIKLENSFHYISLEGDISKDPEKELKLSIQDFDITILNPIVNSKLQGNANGYVLLKDIYNNIFLDSQLNIEELVINKFLIGDIEGKATWDNSIQKLNINYNINRFNEQILTLIGTYDPNNKTSALNINIDLNDTDLQILEPFIKDDLSNLGGKAKGELFLTGNLNAPILKGEVNVINGKFKYNYLNTTYTFNDKIYFLANEIGVRNLQVLDDNGNKAVVKGGVFHDGFKNFIIDLTGVFNNFKVLQTSSKEGSSFYGTAIVSGDFGLSGTFKNLIIKANAKSEAGTKIFIPVSQSSEIGDEEYISFVSKKLKDSSLVASNKPDLSGVILDFNLDITPDAYCEIIFDIRTGDIIRGSGSGKIKMEIDTKGSFNMYGDFIIEKGFYNFTLPGIGFVNKEFNVRQGGRITWNGDPYEANLDLKATYEQYASLKPILQLDPNNAAEIDNPVYNQRVPVTVILSLTGSLLTPQIDLNIDLKEYPTAFGPLGVLAFLSKIRTDEQELNRQAFSLIVLKRLQPAGSFSGAQGSAINSLSEFLSNQLSYWVSQVDEKLEFDLNVNTLDANAYANFQWRMSYSLLKGRLKITRNNNINAYSSQSQNLIGEWTIEYWLAKDGRFRVKMYNRNSQNVINASNSTNTMAGFSLLHTESFNNLGEFLRRRRKKTTDEQTPSQEKDPLNTPLQ